MSSLPRWRLSVLIALFAGWGIALAGRTAYVQIVQHDYFRALADDEHWGKRVLLPLRGAIRDRSGHPLAMTVTDYQVAIDPSVQLTARELAETTERLSATLGVPASRIAAAYAAKGERSVLLKDDVPYDVGTQLASMDLPGVRLSTVVRRVYPEGNLAPQLLGFVGKDQAGLTGLEADFNRELTGRPGVVIYERDTAGNEIPLGLRQEVPPVEGADLILTIDRFMQREAERALAEVVKEQGAAGGTIIVMDPWSGAILAMANQPTFDLRDPKLDDPAQMALYRNPAITDLYEPGSVFKIVTMAAAIQEGKVTPDTTMVDNGVVVKYGWPIRNWNGAANGVQTMTQVLIRSSNVGAVWVSDRIGPEIFYRYVRAFGFGERTQIGLGGEVAGMVKWPDGPAWRPIDLATNSFGQAISVTPLQIITAIAAVVNGGTLMQPYVVKEFDGPTGKRTFQPVTVRRVISAETAAQLRMMMNAVVEKGESTTARVDGYHVGGKTGTSQVVGPDGTYSDATIASFVGFAPLEDPRFVILIKVDRPKQSPWGGTVAGPVFKKLATAYLTYLRVPPSDTQLALQPRGGPSDAHAR